jgi:hypothetical protein
MTTAAPSTALATIQPAFTNPERLALAGYLAGYRGLTREAYAWTCASSPPFCGTRSLALFAVRRADIEGSARDLEAMGRARATVTRRLSTIAGFKYKYAVEEELLDHSPAAHVRRPRLDDSPMPPPWTATSSARCWCRRARPAARAYADLPARAERPAGLGGRLRRPSLPHR